LDYERYVEPMPLCSEWNLSRARRELDLSQTSEGPEKDLISDMAQGVT